MSDNSARSKSNRIFIQVSLSKDEKDKIEKSAYKKHQSMSDFCRVAIFDHIRRIENPELFNPQINAQINPIMIEQLMENTKKMIELQELTLKRTNIMNEMNQTLGLIKKYSTLKGLEHERMVIIDLFKAHKSLSKQEIIDKTGFDKTIVIAIVSDLNEEKIITLTSRGRFELNEETL